MPADGMRPQTVKTSPLRHNRYPWRHPRPDRVITSAGLLTCGSSLCRAFPWTRATVACADIARRLQLRGQSRNCTRCRARTVFPITGQSDPDRSPSRLAVTYGFDNEIRQHEGARQQVWPRGRKSQAQQIPTPGKNGPGSAVALCAIPGATAMPNGMSRAARRGEDGREPPRPRGATPAGQRARHPRMKSPVWRRDSRASGSQPGKNCHTWGRLPRKSQRT